MGNTSTPVSIRLHADDDVVITHHQLLTGTVLPEDGITISGQIIGFASQAIRRGQHEHVHTLGMGEFERDAAQVASSIGIIGIPISVNCSATVARTIVDRFRRDDFPAPLQDFPKVDWLVGLTHGANC